MTQHLGCNQHGHRPGCRHQGSTRDESIGVLLTLERPTTTASDAADRIYGKATDLLQPWAGHPLTTHVLEDLAEASDYFASTEYGPGYAAQMRGIAWGAPLKSLKDDLLAERPRFSEPLKEHEREAVLRTFNDLGRHLSTASLLVSSSTSEQLSARLDELGPADASAPDRLLVTPPPF